MRQPILLRWQRVAALIPAILLASCAREPLGDVVTDTVAPPPSVQTEARAPGTVRVELSVEQARALRIQTVPVLLSEVRFMVDMPGEVFPAPERFAQVSAPISGRVAELYAHEGEPVLKGQPLVALESLEFANIVADYLQARAEEEYQQTERDRLQALVEKKIAARSRLDRTQADLSRAHASVNATYARLRALGMTDRQIASWTSEARERPLLRIYAPITGTIDRHLIDMGQSVTAYQEMMTVVNTEEVLIRAFISPEDASLVRPGNPVTIGLKDVPNRALTAQVSTLNPSVDPENRSVTANILVRTREGWPMPGQSVRIEIEARDTRPVITIPLAAVQYEGGQATVFVHLDSLQYERRPVQIGRVTDSDAVVSAGLAEGERVAVSQVFSLKAMARFDQFAEE